MTIKSFSLLLLLILSSVVPAVGQLPDLNDDDVTVKLIPRAPHLQDPKAKGSFNVKYDKESYKISINGWVEQLSSPLIVPGAPGATTEIHLHHHQLLDQKGPPIIQNLTVTKTGPRAAKFQEEFKLNKKQHQMFLSGMTFVLIHTKKHPKGEAVGYINFFGELEPALEWDKFQINHPLVQQYRAENTNPVLPISRSMSDETDDSPFPPLGPLKENPNLLDSRSDSNASREHRENERYLRLPVKQVDAKTHVIAGTDKKSFYDHPNVQPRPFRPLHLRYAGKLGKFEKRILPTHTVEGEEIPDHPGARMLRNFKERVGSDNTGDFQPQYFFKHLPHLGLADRGPITYADTPPALYPKIDPFKTPPGTNLLPTVYENMRDRQGNEMINTLPSHPNRPYNLHDGDPIVTRLDTLSSPTDDLRLILDEMYEAITGTPVRRIWEQLEQEDLEQLFNNIDEDQHKAKIEQHRARLLHHTEWAIDILEGNAGKTMNLDESERPSRVPGNRAYRGFALLHHSAHKRANRVVPIYDRHGKIVAGQVNIRQIWYDGRIESDTAYYDYGWDDIPLWVKVKGNEQKLAQEAAYKAETDDEESDEYEVRWYSSTDPNLKPYHWKWSRNKDLVEESQVKDLNQTPEPIPHNVPLYATFDVSVLNRGEDDFSTSIVHFDAHEKINLVKPKEVPWGRMNINGDNVEMRFGPPHFAMDATFFPLQEGTKTKIRLKLSDAQYHNVHYTWGWRKHPPRAQAVENMHKRIPPAPSEFKAQFHVMWDHPTAESFFGRAIEKNNLTPRLFRLRIDDHERFVFDGVGDINKAVERYLDEEMVRYPAEEGESSSDHETRIRAKLKTDFERLAELKWLQPPPKDFPQNKAGNPIHKLADLSPAKQMWRAFHGIRDSLLEDNVSPGACLYELIHARSSFLEWTDRNHLPSGFKVDMDSDLTMLFVNNTLYGETSGGSQTQLSKWRTRGTDVKITLINGDYFIHGYANPDFGGLRGYENQFKPTLAVGGQGSLFTFGRFNWRFNVVGGVVPVPPAHLEVRNSDGKFEVTDLAVIKDFTERSNGKNKYRVVPGVHRLMIRFNYEPSRRLRFYQFDPMHHDVAIYSMH